MVKPKVAFLSLFILFFLSACISPDLEVSSEKKVVIYTDHIGSQDSLLYKDFQKSEKIKVYVKYYSSEKILKIIQDEKYDSHADLIILHGANQLTQAERLNLFRTYSTTEINKNIPKNYVSPYKKWISLSKTPMVIAFDKRLLNVDTISNYSDLLFPNWKGKVALQEVNHSTLSVLESSLSHLKDEILHDFNAKLSAQSKLSRSGNDLTQLKRIQTGQAEVAIIELASMEKRVQEKDTLSKQLKNQVGVIFPSQTKKGSFYNITGAGIYRYARNPESAQKLLNYLTSKGPQYFFASGRMEFPVNESVKINARLEEYGKFRARFYAPKIH